MTFHEFAPWLGLFAAILSAVVTILLTSRYRAIIGIYKNGMGEVVLHREQIQKTEVKLTEIGGVLVALTEGQNRLEKGQEQMTKALKDHGDLLHPRRKR